MVHNFCSLMRVQCESFLLTICALYHYTHSFHYIEQTTTLLPVYFIVPLYMNDNEPRHKHN